MCVCVCVSECVCVCISDMVYVYICIYLSIHVRYVYTGLEIGSIASPNTNHFWGNCESLWRSDSPNFFGTANHFWPIANLFSNGFA